MSLPLTNHRSYIRTVNTTFAVSQQTSVVKFREYLLLNVFSQKIVFIEFGSTAPLQSVQSLYFLMNLLMRIHEQRMVHHPR